MTCQDCYSPECRKDALAAEAPKVHEQDGYGTKYYLACEALDDERDACRRRSHTEGILARIGSLEARLTALETKT